MQAPTGNVDYRLSQLTQGTRTMLGIFQNTTGGSKSNATITLYGSGSMEDASDSLLEGANSHLKLCSSTSSAVSTAWIDAGSPYTSNNKDVDGAGGFVGDGGLLLLTTWEPDNTSLTVTFNGGSWLTNQYMLGQSKSKRKKGSVHRQDGDIG